MVLLLLAGILIVGAFVAIALIGSRMEDRETQKRREEEVE